MLMMLIITYNWLLKCCGYISPPASSKQMQS